MLTGFNFTRQANWSVTQVWIHYLDNTCVNKLISIQENFHHSLKAVAQITRARNFDKSTAFVNVLDRQTGDNRSIEFVIVASDHTDNIVLSHCDIQGKEGRWNRAVWKPHMASASRTFLGRFGWFAHCCWSWPFTSSIARSWRKTTGALASSMPVGIFLHPDDKCVDASNIQAIEQKFCLAICESAGTTVYGYDLVCCINSTFRVVVFQDYLRFLIIPFGNVVCLSQCCEKHHCLSFLWNMWTKGV